MQQQMIFIDKFELFKEIEILVSKAIAESNKVKAPRYYSNKEAADLLGISVSTIDRLRKKGVLKYFQHGATVIIPDFEINRMIYTNKAYLNSHLVALQNPVNNAVSTLE